MTEAPDDRKAIAIAFDGYIDEKIPGGWEVGEPGADQKRDEYDMRSDAFGAGWRAALAAHAAPSTSSGQAGAACERLMAALEFYASEDTWACLDSNHAAHCGPGDCMPAIDGDLGERARAALAAAPDPGEPTERLREMTRLVADALPLMEDEWIAPAGPMVWPGSGGEWIVRARAALAAAPDPREGA